MRKICLLLLVLITGAFPLLAQDVQPSSRPKIGLVLAGGGAKGAAHIGVLKVLEEAGIRADYVAGTSIGSIVGSMYALGYSADEMEQIISGLDWEKLLSNEVEKNYRCWRIENAKDAYQISAPFGNHNGVRKSLIESFPNGVIDGNNIINELKGYMVGYHDPLDYNDLPVPFSCVASDLVADEQYNFHSGILPYSVYASMSIPVVFAPRKLDGRLFIDGAFTSNMPVEVCREMGADFIISVDIGKERDKTIEESGGMVTTAFQVVRKLANAKIDENRSNSDMLFLPDIEDYNALSFDEKSIAQLIRNGYECALEQKEALKALAATLAVYDVPHHSDAPKAINIFETPVTLGAITVEGETPEKVEFLIRRTNLTEGEKVSGQDIESAMAIFYGTGVYRSATYLLSETGDGVYEMRIILEPKAPHSLDLGLRCDTQEAIAAKINVGLNKNRLDGLSADFGAKLSISPELGAAISYAFPSVARLNLSYNARSVRYPLFDKNSWLNTERYASQKVEATISEYYSRLLHLSAGIRWSIFSENFVNWGSRQLAYIADAEFNSLDDNYFPTKGVMAEINLDHTNFKMRSFASVSLSAKVPVSFGRRFTIIPQLYGRIIKAADGLAADGYDDYYSNFAGGPDCGRFFVQQLSFVGMVSLFDKELGRFAAVPRIDARVQIGRGNYLTATANLLSYKDNANSSSISFARGYGLEFSRRIAYIGPLKIGLGYSDYTRRLCAYGSVGLSF